MTTSDTIKVHYSSIDGCRETRTFKTLKGARRYAQEMVGEHPEMGSRYAVSGDGVGKVTITAMGHSLASLFPSDEPDLDAAYEEAERAHRAEEREAFSSYGGISDYQRACEDGSLLEWERTNGDW
jgi:hypothetical protein